MILCLKAWHESTIWCWTVSLELKVTATQIHRFFTGIHQEGLDKNGCFKLYP